jgi:sec-independent protein translocase protein TatA
MGEIVLVLVIALLIFGPSKLPQLGDALGKSIRSFRKATTGHDEPEEAAQRSPERPQLVPPAASPGTTQEKTSEPTASVRR